MPKVDRHAAAEVAFKASRAPGQGKELIEINETLFFPLSLSLSPSENGKQLVS
jgi:hypothetical protein